MGFMDRLKGAGKNLAAKMATRYGTVTKGKYAGAEVALGTDPSAANAVSVVGQFSQIVFLNGSEEVGRETIGKDVTVMHVFGEKPSEKNEKENVMEIDLRYADGETSVIELNIACHDAVSNALNLLSGSDSLTPEQKVEKKYHHIHTFLKTFYGITADESFSVIKKFIIDHGWAGIKEFESYRECVSEKTAALAMRNAEKSQNDEQSENRLQD